ncbi:MAG: exosome complex protein Rrp42 [Candidatus Aenigmarchaeota archaeon]|nr:exosome complex protein Rrp42 [Candidatus Aenigmarchaeota archaeon]
MIETDKELIKNIVMKGKRLDKRAFDEYRKIAIESGVISSAEGSARVRIGDTEVVAGVKMDIGEPYPDSKDAGVLTVNAEFLPLASEEFESGPPREDSIELARVVDRAIRESKCIDFKKLCIEEGKKVWMVFVDISVIDHDGNLIDAAGLASVQALASARMPKLIKNKDSYEVDYENRSKEKLPMSGIPVSTTFVKIGGQIMADPLLSEELAMDARLTVGTFDSNGKIRFCSMQKGGNGGFTEDEIAAILDMAEEKGEELRKLIKKG